MEKLFWVKTKDKPEIQYTSERIIVMVQLDESDDGAVEEVFVFPDYDHLGSKEEFDAKVVEKWGPEIPIWTE